MSARWINVDATIVECFRAWDEPPGSAHPWFEIVADIETHGGAVERVSSHQRLNTIAHRWRAPDPGDVVGAQWDPAQRRLRLALSGDPRYDERLMRVVARPREAPTWPPVGFGN